MGAILYELLTGRVPFRKSTALATLRAVLEEPPQPPHQIVPGVDPDLETICLKCLEKDPRQRYQTAAELAAELGRFIDGWPVLARPVSTAGRVARWCRRKPALAGSMAVAALVLVAGFIGVLWQWRRAEAHAQALRQESYYSGITLADFYIEQGDISRALEELLECPPEHRDWEWGYLMYRCHQDALSIPAHADIELPPREIYVNDVPFLNTLSFDASGNLLATLGRDGRLKVWSSEDGRQLTSFGDAANPVTAFAFGARTNDLALGFANGQLRVVSTADWAERFALDTATNAVRHLAYDLNGMKLAFADADGRVRLFDAETGQALRVIEPMNSPIDSLRFTTDSRALVIGFSSRASLLDLDSGQISESLGDEATNGVGLVVDPRGERYVHIDSEGRVALRGPLSEALELERIKGALPWMVRRAFFSPDASLVCIGGEEGTAAVYRSADGTKRFSIPNRVHLAVFSPDGGQLATLGTENIIRLWDVERGRELKVLRGHEALVHTMAFSPGSEQIATGDGQGTVKIWSARNGREVLEGDAWMWALAVSPDGQRIACSPADQYLIVWDARSGGELLRIEVPFQEIQSAAFSPDGTRIATSSGADRTAWVWDSQTGAPLLVLRGHSRFVCGVDYSPDGRRLATASLDGTAKLWAADTGQELLTLDHGTNYVLRVAFSPDSRRILTTGEHGVGIWDADGGQLLASTDRPGPGEGFAIFDRSGDRIITTDWDSFIHLLDGRTARELQRWPANAFTKLAALSPDGKRLVVGTTRAYAGMGLYGTDRPIAELYDIASGRRVLRLQGHRDLFWQSAFTGDGRRIISGSFDWTVRQWETFPWKISDYPGSSEAPLRDRIRRYADNYWRQRLAAEATGHRVATQTLKHAVARPDRSHWPSRPTAATSNQIDLTDHYTGILRAWFYPHFDWDRVDNDLAELTTGLVTFDNVLFDVRGVVQLRRTEPLGGLWQKRWERHPVRVDGIAVHRPFHRLHALLGTDQREQDGRMIGHLIWHYADGAAHESPIRYGEDVRQWWERPNEPSETSRARVAWRGSNPPAAREGASLRLYLSTWENPRPGVEVQTLDLVSELAGAAPFVIATTVE
jgi:eukaryotic-like serine/threonine-protein kinase